MNNPEVQAAMKLAELRTDPDWQAFDGSSAVHLSREEIGALLSTTDPALASLRDRVAQLEAPSDMDRDVFVLAKQHASDGDLEIDANAVISYGDDNGAYVAAFKWVPFAGTHLDRDASDEDGCASSPRLREG